MLIVGLNNGSSAIGTVLRDKKRNVSCEEIWIMEFL